MGKIRGFTLLELMIASVVLIIALVGVITIYINCFALNESGKNLSIAINDAQCVMEEIRSRNNLSIITGVNWTTWAQTNPPNGGGCNSLTNQQVTVSYTDRDNDGNALNDDPLQVTVTVNWQEKGRAKSTQLVSLVTER